MKKRGFPGDNFWYGAERFNYFILFPALLFSSLLSSPLDNRAMSPLLAAMVLALFVCGLGLLIVRKFKKWPAFRFGVLLQGILRSNIYLGLAAVGGMYGKEGIETAAVIIAVFVPTVNVLSILALSADRHTTFKSLFFTLTTNPLLVACLVGALLNLSGVQMRWGVERLMSMLANTSLPLGLLSVGAALKVNELRGHSGALISNSFTKLLIVPGVAWICAHLFKVTAVETAILVLFFALPTAPTAYVLTQQLKGDGDLMAGIITLQTLLSPISILVVMAAMA